MIAWGGADELEALARDRAHRAGLAITHALAVCQRAQMPDAVLDKLLEAKQALMAATAQRRSEARR